MNLGVTSNRNTYNSSPPIIEYERERMSGLPAQMNWQRVFIPVGWLLVASMIVTGAELYVVIMAIGMGMIATQRADLSA